MFNTRMMMCAISSGTFWISLTILVSSIEAEVPFSSLLQKLADDVLGVKPFQEYLDRQPSISKPNTDLGGIVKSIADNIDSDISNHVEALREFNRAVLADLRLTASETTPPVQCCNLTEVEADVRFRTALVNSSTYCRVSDSWPNNLSFKENALPVAQENLRRIPSLKWQFFGSRDGSAFVYPADSKCLYNYDPRFRPWYHSVAGGSAKDIVILVDTSKTMSEAYGSTAITRLKVAVDTATTIVKTLTPNDRVNVLAFDESVRYPTADSCYKDSLAPGTTQNIAALADYLNTVVSLPRGAQYGKALREAFKLLTSMQSSQTTSDRVKVILLLTDGNATDYTDVYCTLQKENALANNSVVVTTFGIDPTMTDSQKEFLQRIAQQDFNATCNVSAQSSEKPRVGIFIHVKESSADYLRTQIGFYYDAFRLPDKNDVVFNVPFQDPLGLGLVMAACLPVINSTQLLGVTCVDIALDLAFNELINFKLGQLSYAYLIDGHGRALLHPAVPKPQTFDTTPVFVDISSIETSPRSADIKKSMISGLSGSMSDNAILVKNRGSDQLQGVDTYDSLVTFVWHPIPVLNTSVCLVIIDGETKKVRSWNGGSFPPVYLVEHVNYDNSSDTSLCRQWEKASSVAGSMVKLAPMSFGEPFNYSLIKNELTPETKQLQDFLEGRSNNAGVLGVQDGVREAVALTYALDNIWKNTVDPSYWTYTLFRYIGTRERIFRKYPATLQAKEYDPTQRPWYAAAVGAGQIGKITVSTPYPDTSGAIILTICQTVYEGSNSSHLESDPVFGVMGLDITLSSFYNLLVTKFVPCAPENNQRCLVVDNNGFVIVHRDYLSNGPPKSPEHITYKELKIAYELKETSILTSDTCADYANIRLQTFWRVQLSQMRDLSTCTIYPVEGSNLFIIAPTVNSPTEGACQCNKAVNGECLQNVSCQCPCYSSVDFNDCSGVLNVTATVPCLPPIATPLNSTEVNTKMLLKGKTLPDCRPCDVPDLFTNQTLCEDTQRCCWHSENSTCLFTCPTTPTNSTTSTTSTNSTSPATSTKPSPSTAATVVPIAVGIPLIIELVILIVVNNSQ